MGNLHSLYSIGTMKKQLPVCQLFGSIFAVQTLSVGCHISLSQWWHTVCQMSDTHFLGVCVCIVCWWCCLGTRHLSGLWSLTAQGYMLHWFGEVTSIVSSCQLSGGVCYPTNHMHKIFILCMDLCQTYKVCNYCIVLFLNDFCPHILSFVSCINL